MRDSDKFQSERAWRGRSESSFGRHRQPYLDKTITLKSQVKIISHRGSVRCGMHRLSNVAHSVQNRPFGFLQISLSRDRLHPSSASHCGLLLPKPVYSPIFGKSHICLIKNKCSYIFDAPLSLMADLSCVRLSSEGYDAS